MALGWHKRGIKDVEQAKASGRGYTKGSFAVMRAMGLSDRSPAEVESEFIEKWFWEYGFTRELIVEACSRTIRQIHKPSFDYADKILRDWKNAGVKSFRDVSELDKKRKEEGGAKRRQASAGSSRSSNRFHNLEEHGYDYDEMVWSMINGAQKTGGTMALSNSQYESIMRVYNRTQLQKKHELDARVDEVYEKIPAVREMNDAIAAAAVKSAKELLAGDADAVKRLRETIADLKEQRQVLMSAYGYPADYLEMQYNCPDCKDTGYKDGKKCHCFRQREIDLLYAQSNIREVLERGEFSPFFL